jgi:hypothetical protein
MVMAAVRTPIGAWAVGRALRAMQSGVWRRRIWLVVRPYLAGTAIGGWFGSGIGIAAFGTAISGIVPFAILGFLGNWVVYRYGKRAMVALLKYLKYVAIRGLDGLVRAVRRYLAGIAIGAWFGSGIGIVALGTAISGMVPGAILGFLITWLIYHSGKWR